MNVQISVSKLLLYVFIHTYIHLYRCSFLGWFYVRGRAIIVVLCPITVVTTLGIIHKSEVPFLSQPHTMSQRLYGPPYSCSTPVCIYSVPVDTYAHTHTNTHTYTHTLTHTHTHTLWGNFCVSVTLRYTAALIVFKNVRDIIFCDIKCTRKITKKSSSQKYCIYGIRPGDEAACMCTVHV